MTTPTAELVKKLRRMFRGLVVETPLSTLKEAADALEALQAELYEETSAHFRARNEATELQLERYRYREALQKIHDYRSDSTDYWNMVMAIAEDAINPMIAVPSAALKGNKDGQ